MKKSNITGWKDVFSFTLTQTVKAKSFIISNIVILTLLLVSMPIVNKFTGNSADDSGVSPVKKVYVNNETNLNGIDFKEVLKDERFSHIIFEDMSKDYETLADHIDKEEQDAVILTLQESEANYALNFVRPSSGPLKESTIRPLADAIFKEFKSLVPKAVGATEDQLAMIRAEVTTKIAMADVSGVEIVKEDTSISQAEYWFVYGILFVVMMTNIMASTQVAYSIVTEKSTKVIEFLLISVKPLAIVVGKVLAMLTAVILEVVAMAAALLVSNKVTASMSDGASGSILARYIPKDIFQNINIGNLLICLVLIAFGMIFYAVLAALAGATVSKLEEIQEGLTLFTLVNLIGAYVGLGAASVLMASGVNAFVTFSFLFPLSAPFILPGAILVGKVSLPLAVGAIALQILFIILLFNFVAKVYETLILHTGNKIKLKQLIKISKTV
ncbi:ABC transporter permease [Clostridium thermarum]|uniref:ABC transporter permease n=1 Tax=Clostridium thermarum TaxID=1716543 RepID=UPI0013D35826|nr:ABC transporter permease [Clostridium thermarum]